jgi:hypothetical protein
LSFTGKLIAYKLRWIGNILTGDVLKEYLGILGSYFLGFFVLPGLIQVSFGRVIPLQDKNISCKYELSQKRLEKGI